MRYKTGGYNVAFSDIVLCLVLVIAAALILTLLLINPIARDATVKKKAEYIIEMRWPDEIDCDVDLHVLAPSNIHISYLTPDTPFANLERDDLGLKSDTIKIGDDEYVTSENLEIWTLRTFIVGDYIVNAHLYGCGHKRGSSAINEIINKKFPVTLKLIRLNPSYEILDEKVVMLERIWQELTAFKFSLDHKGEPKLNKSPPNVGIVSEKMKVNP